MPPSPPDPSHESPSPESSRPRRHLYLLEAVLGGAILLVIVLILVSGPRSSTREAAAKRSDRTAGRFTGKVKVAKLNIDGDGARDIAADYGISFIPQVMLFRKGVPERIAINPGDLAASEASIAAAIDRARE